MPDDTSADRLLDHFDVELTQHQRLLRLELGAPAGLLPHRLVGEEAVSAPFRYRLDCLCQRGDLELKHLIGAPARLAIRQADASERPLHALVAEAARRPRWPRSWITTSTTPSPAFSPTIAQR